MAKKLLLVISLLLVSYFYAVAQPPCSSPPPPGAEACFGACVYCDFGGYMGINNGTPSGGAAVCNGQIAIHNDQWFGFIAGTTNITINISTSNCQNGDGLQAAFFEDCTGEAIECNAGSGGNGGGALQLTYSGFVPGQAYFLMIDGWTGDVCNFTIEVLDGSVSAPPVGPLLPIEGPTTVCPGGQAVYSVPPVSGAGEYVWTVPPGCQINGVSAIQQTIESPEGEQITVTWGPAGGQVCVRAV